MSYKHARVVEHGKRRERAKAKAKAVKIDNKMKTKELLEVAKARPAAAKKHEVGMQEFVKNLKQGQQRRGPCKEIAPR